ncbi:MAG: cytochrome C biogenesis protein CcsA, partial [Pseudomonas sp.]
MKNILLALATLGAALSLSTAMADDGAALFKSIPCAACHTIDSK